MIHPPAKEDLPKGYATQEHWLAAFRGGCNQCHQLGMVATRRHTDVDDWEGIFQRNQGMGQAADRLGRELLEKTLVDWELRIKAGEVPPAPPRPTGIERNFVVSQWDWGTHESFFHDVTSTDKRNPTLYAYGKVYGADRTGGGVLWVLDPVKNTVDAAAGAAAKLERATARKWTTTTIVNPRKPGWPARTIPCSMNSAGSG